jgi:hypothetical protein
MAKMKKEKDQFDDLDDDWKSSVQSMDAVEIKKKVAEIALEHSRLLRAKRDDEDLKTKREEYKTASAIYRENAKMSKVRIEFLRSVLESKGQ